MPLGTIITSSESQDLLEEAFTIYKSLLPSTVFKECGSLGKAFKSVFPNSEHLLCQLHLLEGADH